MPARTGKRKRTVLPSPQNLDGSGAYAADTPDTRVSSESDTESQGTRDSGTASKDEALARVGEAIHMLAVAQAAQTAKDNKLGCALEAIVADERKKRAKDKKGEDARARRYGAPPPPPRAWDTDVMPVDGLHPQEVGDLSLQPRNCKHRDAAAIAYMNGLLRAAHTEDTREDSPAVPLDPALVRMIPVGRTGETADGDLLYKRGEGWGLRAP